MCLLPDHLQNGPAGREWHGSPSRLFDQTMTNGFDRLTDTWSHLSAMAMTWAPGLGPDLAGTKYLETDLSPGQKNIVKIKVTGYRSDQSKEADRLAGFKGAKPPKDYTWHHGADYDPATGEGTMQLVETCAHEAAETHKGSVWR